MPVVESRIVWILFVASELWFSCHFIGIAQVQETNSSRNCNKKKNLDHGRIPQQPKKVSSKFVALLMHFYMACAPNLAFSINKWQWKIKKNNRNNNNDFGCVCVRQCVCIRKCEWNVNMNIANNNSKKDKNAKIMWYLKRQRRQKHRFLWHVSEQVKNKECFERWESCTRIKLK